ncbi:MAG: hypothetical protein HQK50_12780 [Oligoflexia bacterium]|nr:hypothetical protein [Oligoflexia bacterium]
MQYRKLELMSSNPEEEVTTMSSENERECEQEGESKDKKRDRASAQEKQSASFKLTKFFTAIDDFFDAAIYRFKRQSSPNATRYNLQLGRRLFHFSNGAVVATMYNLFLEHRQVVYALGLVASLLYLIEQIRLAYPEIAGKFRWFSNFLLRAEEEIKESAAVPYSMALLLTILSFPKVVAVIAIYTLAFADPMSAIIGILYGKRKIARNKTLEGSLAFFVTTLAVCLLVLLTTYDGFYWAIIKVSVMVALFSSMIELLPIRIDDNLTIPLSTAIIAWIFCAMAGLPL